MHIQKISYPDKEGDLDLEWERETDLDGGFAGERCEDLTFGDLLNEGYNTNLIKNKEKLTNQPWCSHKEQLGI